jgi:hypothetical protein
MALCGHAAALEEHGARVRRVDAQLVVRFLGVKPGVPFGTMKADTPLAPAARSVVANTSMKSAWGPFVIQFLLPLMTQLPSPCRSATVCMLLASEPLWAR